jgi:hypothetical protein
MPRLKVSQASEPRKGVILMIVIILLTLFAVVGLTFYLYSGSEETSSRIFREAYNIDDLRPDESVKDLLNFSLGQFIYDTNDQINPWSGIRGWSLARDMFGWKSDFAAAADTSIYPFNGTGRLHFSSPPTLGPLVPDDFNLINYTAFLDASGNLVDGFIRDPERVGYRTALTQSPSTLPYTGGWNPSYTYPDLNHLYLAAVQANGNLLLPSFYRPWLFDPTGLGLNNPANPNWTNAQGKYLTLRPRPFDNDPTFPLPGDATGDVKNLIGAPGGNDSIWIDLGYPVKVGPDGTKYKPLFAFLIMDLDNRLNINVSGNIRGTGNTHVSNQGLDTWERNPAKMVAPNDPNASTKIPEWANLITGNTVSGKVITGRYGMNGSFDGVPQQVWAPGPDASLPGLYAHLYAQLDFDSCNDGPGGSPTGQIVIPSATNPSFTGIPTFPAGYYSGCSNGTNAPPLERQNHPALFDFFHPGLTWTGQKTDDKVFDISNMKSLLVSGYSGTDYKNTDLGQLLPQNLGDTTPIPGNPSGVTYGQKMRQVITTHSFDVDQPGPTPFVWDETSLAGNGNYTLNGAANAPPSGSPISFPALSNRAGSPPASSEFSADWRWNLQWTLSGTLIKVLKRVDLNRFLPPYPHMGSGTTPQTYVQGPMANSSRFDFNAAVYQQFQAAQTARQQLADDIYRLLIKVTGVAAPVTPNAPTPAELMPRRWLAQLAANIVDFIDEDEISTPFNFYNQEDGFTGNIYDTSVTNTGVPNYYETLKYWVFGTELPRVALNEVLSEVVPTPTTPPPPPTSNYTFNFYAELVHTLPSPASLPNPQQGSVQPVDANAVPLYVPAGGGGSTAYTPYWVAVNSGAPVVLDTKDGTGTEWNNNVLGTPDNNVADATGCLFLTPMPSAGQDFAQGAGQTPSVPNNGTAGPPVPTAIYPQGTASQASYFLVGSTNADIHKAIDQKYGVPANTPYMQSGPGVNNLSWQTTTLPTPIPQMNFLLRRLSNPYLPPNFTPSGGAAPNMYQTVDYMTATNTYPSLTPFPPAWPPPGPWSTTGKQQPLAADPSQLVAQTGGNAGNGTANTFGQRNAGNAQGYYDWLVHLDRQLISPMELLQVSGYRPHELTQYFIKPTGKYKHLVPWFDQPGLPGSPTGGQSCRLWRAFDFLECHDRYTGVSVGGRIPGKVNVNTLYDLPTPGGSGGEVFRALCDQQGSNFFSTTDVDQVLTNLINMRSPGLSGATPTLGASDKPFLSTAVGNIASGNANDPFAPSTGTGIGNTIFAPVSPGGPTLLQAPSQTGSHPYVAYEMLNKIYNNLTTRSNVFAVFITVGYFQVVDDTTRPVKLGAEIGLTTNQNIRHRLFAIVDRTNLTLIDTSNPTYMPAVTTLAANVGQGAQQTVAFQANAGTTTPASSQDAAIPWQIVAGSTLVIDTGPNQETVVISVPSPGTFTANFQRNHAQGAPVYIPGNPGPQSLFDVQDPKYSPVVPYIAVLQ